MKDRAQLLEFIRADSGLTALHEEICRRLGDDPGHDVAHCLRVALWTIRLGADAIDRRQAIAAALLHDVVNLPKDSPDRVHASEWSAKLARELLPQSGFAPSEIDAVASAIRAHSFSRGLVPDTPLGDALQDADRLEALGALGILRAASCGTRMGADYFDPDDPWSEHRALDDRRHTIDHFFTKLLRLPKTLRTSAGREEAQRRADFMVEFLKQIGAEIGSAPPASICSTD